MAEEAGCTEEEVEDIKALAGVKEEKAALQEKYLDKNVAGGKKTAD